MKPTYSLTSLTEQSHWICSANFWLCLPISWLKCGQVAQLLGFVTSSSGQMGPDDTLTVGGAVLPLPCLNPPVVCSTGMLHTQFWLSSGGDQLFLLTCLLAQVLLGHTASSFPQALLVRLCWNSLCIAAQAVIQLLAWVWQTGH